MSSDRRKTILIVDDDEGMRETLTAMLRRDYRVLRAATGEFALQILRQRRRVPGDAERLVAVHRVVRLRRHRNMENEIGQLIAQLLIRSAAVLRSTRAQSTRAEFHQGSDA